MPNSIAYTQNYTTIIDEVYQRASVSRMLNSGRRMVRAGRNAKEIMIPKITVFGLGDYVRNKGYKTGSINYEFETKAFDYDRGIRLMADVMDVEEAGVLHVARWRERRRMGKQQDGVHVPSRRHGEHAGIHHGSVEPHALAVAPPEQNGLGREQREAGDSRIGLPR